MFIGENVVKVTATGGLCAIHISAHNQFQLFDRAKVTAGDSESGATLIPYTPDPDSRVEACQNNKYARIERCDHPGEGSCTITKEKHIINCAYCAVPAGEAAHFFGANGEGECVCDAWNVKYLDPVSGAMQGPVFCLPAGESMAGGGVSEGWYASGRSASFENRLYVTGKVNLILCDGATLDAKKGVGVGSGDELIVWAQKDGSGMGALNADGGSEAGIGDNEGSGRITINGGAVTGTSSGDRAGIGGCDGGFITINGGRVTGECTGPEGAGIGGSGFITINGGVVRGTAAVRGSGIGSKSFFICDKITITGGTVTGTSRGGGAGIGTGDYGAGIGSGLDARSDSMVTLDWIADTCEGMSVTATGYNGAVSLNRPFKNKIDESEIFSGDIADLTALAGKTLVPHVIPPESIVLEPATAKLLVGKSKSLTAAVAPGDFPQVVTWTSSDDNVATVDQNGKVTGKATITATTINGLTAECAVTVYRAPTGVKLTPTKKALKVKKTLKLKVTVKGKNAYPTLTWTSSNKKVATVSKKGVVTALKPGRTTITVKTVNGKKAKCIITVTKSMTSTIKFD